jgi:fumarate hydratase class II
LISAASELRDAIATESIEWKDIIKIGRTHMQDATALILGSSIMPWTKT